MSALIPTYPDLAGKVAVVTGSSQGIGAATCRMLAANGVKVVVNGRTQAAVDATVDDLRSRGGHTIGIVADARDRDALERLRLQTERELGPVDLLAAFVGGGGMPAPITQITEDDWRATIEANLTSTFLTVQTFLSGMIERRRGSIVSMASTAGRLPGEASASYAAAKASVVMFTRQLAREAGPHGVRANCLAPSAVMTDRLLARIPEAQRQQMAAGFPLGRLGEPDDVASAALFLLSDSSSWITGITVDVTGGRVSL